MYEIQEYSTIFLYFMIGAILAIILVKLAQFLAIQTPDIEKISQYECGFQHISDIYSPLDLHFFRICILFLIFDVELSLLFPFSAFFDLHSPNWEARISLLIFTFFLALSFYYETWEEMLDWTRPYKAL
jgi:NADH-quinone oxidoreductase subunit A